MATAFKQHTDNASAAIAASGALNNTTNPITISLETGKGALFAAPGNGQYVTIYDKTTYPDPFEDPAMEKAVITARTGDSITLSRAAAVAHAGTPVVAELMRSAPLDDLQTAVNAAEAAVATKSGLLFDAIVAPSGADYTTIGDALAAGKTRIRVMPGTYTEGTAFNTYTSPSTKIYIEGLSRDDCIIKITGATYFFDVKVACRMANITLWVSTTTAATDGTLPGYVKVRDDFHMINCKILGNDNDNSGSVFFGLGNTGKTFSLRDCFILNLHGNDYIYAKDKVNPKDVIIQGCLIDSLDTTENHPSNALFATISCASTDINIVGNTIISPTFAYTPSNPMIRITGAASPNFLMAGNVVRNSYSTLLFVKANAGAYANYTITGNTFDCKVANWSFTDSNQALIDYDGASVNVRWTITGNMFYLTLNNTGTVGIHMESPNNAVIANNNFNSYYSAESSRFVQLVSPVDCLIAGNAFHDCNGTTAIALNITGATTSYVDGNIFDNCTTGYANASGTTYSPIQGILLGVATVAATAPTSGGTLSAHYGGDTNYLGDPALWIPIKIGANSYKIPLYS